MLLAISQGHVIPLALFEDLDNIYLNIFLIHFLLFIIGLFMSWYPTYVYAAFFGSNDKIKWEMIRCGLILYKPDDTINHNIPKAICDGVYKKEDSKTLDICNKSPKSSKNAKRYETHVRKFMGMMVFNVFGWMLIEIRGIHYSSDYDSLRLIFLGLTVLSIYAFTRISQKYEKVKTAAENERIKNDNEKNDLCEQENEYDKAIKVLSSFICKMQRYTIALFLLSLILLLLIIWSSHAYSWSTTTIIFELILLTFLSLLNLFLRTIRKYSSWKLLSNTKYYLELNRVLGILTLLIIIGFNVSESFATQLNPLIIICSYIIAFYTILIIPLKAFLYLNSDSNNNRIWNIINHYRFNITFLALLILFTLGLRNGSLHELRLTWYDEENEVDISSFIKHVDDLVYQEEPLIFYSAYGGGLKAHYWNLLLLDELDKQGLFSNIISMSGVSGGAMGIASFSAIKYLEEAEINNAFNRYEYFNKIGNSNALGLEMSWLLGYDLLRELVPINYTEERDRSYRSIDYYSNILNTARFKEESFSYIYKSLYNNLDFYPNIIFNSTSTDRKYGVVDPFKEVVYPGAHDLLHLDNGKTPTFFEGVTITNRFPLISPAAKINGVGYFVDGGYFENSAVLSNWYFYKYLKERVIHFENQTALFLSIRNSKTMYLDYLYERYNNMEHHCVRSETQGQMEVISVLNGAVSLDRLPFVIENTIEDNEEDISFKAIDLPYFYTIDEVEDYLENKCELNCFWKIVEESNTCIKKCLQDGGYNMEWGIVNPPTSRYLSAPVKLYMESMMDHPFLKEQLMRVYQNI